MLKTSHMQEMKRRYLSMYIPAETVDDQFNEHCGVCDEQGIEEAVLADRDYKYDGKVIKISKKNFSKVHRDFKNSTKGQEMMMTYDDKAGTVSVPVEFTEEVEVDENFAVLNEALKPRDKAVIDAFYSRKGNLASNLLSVEGGKLTKMGMGGQEIAIWKNDKIVINAKMDVKSTEEIVRYMKKSIPSGVFEEVEIDEKFNKKKFDDNEDKNDHTGNGVELVNMFGTTSEKKTMAQIQKNHDKNGEISRKDQSTRDAMVKKYYPKLEEVELDERAKGDSIEGPAKGKKHKCPTYVKKEGYGYGKNISHSLSENIVDKMNIYWYDSKEVSFMMPTSEVEIVTEGMHSEEGHTEKFKSTKKIAEELRKLPNPFENIQEDGEGMHDPTEPLEVGSHPNWPDGKKKKKKKVMEKRSVSFARKFYQKGEK